MRGTDDTTGAGRGARRPDPAPVRRGDQRGFCGDPGANELGAERYAAERRRAQSDAILATALLAAILGWDGHLLAMTDKPLFGFCRFLINLALVFIYMFLLMASAHPECLLWTLAVIFIALRGLGIS
jgi:hypothetical protein